MTYLKRNKLMEFHRCDRCDPINSLGSLLNYFTSRWSLQSKVCSTAATASIIDIRSMSWNSNSNALKAIVLCLRQRTTLVHGKSMAILHCLMHSLLQSIECHLNCSANSLNDLFTPSTFICFWRCEKTSLVPTFFGSPN